MNNVKRFYAPCICNPIGEQSARDWIARVLNFDNAVLKPLDDNERDAIDFNTLSVADRVLEELGRLDLDVALSFHADQWVIVEAHVTTNDGSVDQRLWVEADTFSLALVKVLEVVTLGIYDQGDSE